MGSLKIYICHCYWEQPNICVTFAQMSRMSVEPGANGYLAHVIVDTWDDTHPQHVVEFVDG